MTQPDPWAIPAPAAVAPASQAFKPASEKAAANKAPADKTAADKACASKSSAVKALLAPPPENTTTLWPALCPNPRCKSTAYKVHRTTPFPSRRLRDKTGQLWIGLRVQVVICKNCGQRHTVRIPMRQAAPGEE